MLLYLMRNIFGMQALAYGAVASSIATAAAAVGLSIPSNVLSALPTVVANVLPKILAKQNMLPLFALTGALTVGQFVIDDFFFLKYFYYPDWGCWYRLHGPGKNPAVLYEVLGRFPFFAQMAPLFKYSTMMLVFGKFECALGYFLKTITFGRIGHDVLYWGTPKNRILHGATHRAVDNCYL